VPDTETILLGIGIYVVVFSISFLASLPLIGEQHGKGEDVSPLLWRIVFINLFSSLLLTLAGFGIYYRFIL
jgi:hypothetical protein